MGSTDESFSNTEGAPKRPHSAERLKTEKRKSEDTQTLHSEEDEISHNSKKSVGLQPACTPEKDTSVINTREGKQRVTMTRK